MRDLGWATEGVEPDPAAAALARRAGLTITEGTIDDLDSPGRAGGFSAITMSHVLEHVHEPRRTLVVAHRLLRPGGTLWIATPNLRSLGHRLFGANWLGLDPPRHLALFTHASLARLLDHAGFNDIDVRRASPEATLTFPESAKVVSARIAEGERIQPPRGLAARAATADVLALRRPTLGEDVVVTARKPRRDDPAPTDG
jgi:SAM-dependent methyltransferase